MQCLRLAMWASPHWDRACPVTGLGGSTRPSPSTPGRGSASSGAPDTWMLMDGATGSADAGDDRDGLDMGGSSVGFRPAGPGPRHRDPRVVVPDAHRAAQRPAGPHGAGPARAGGGNDDELPAARDRSAGGTDAGHAGLRAARRCGRRYAGCAHRAADPSPADGQRERVSTAAAGVVVEAGERLRDPLRQRGRRRRPARSAARSRWPTTSSTVASRVDEASESYGVMLDETGRVLADATKKRRTARRKDRLRRAAPPARPFDGPLTDTDGPALPLYPGVVHRGGVAFASASGEPLATAPAHWTDGCPVLESRPVPGPGSSPVPTLIRRAGACSWWRPFPRARPAPSKSVLITGSVHEDLPQRVHGAAGGDERVERSELVGIDLDLHGGDAAPVPHGANESRQIPGAGPREEALVHHLVGQVRRGVPERHRPAARQGSTRREIPDRIARHPRREGDARSRPSPRRWRAPRPARSRTPSARSGIPDCGKYSMWARRSWSAARSHTDANAEPTSHSASVSPTRRPRTSSTVMERAPSEAAAPTNSPALGAPVSPGSQSIRPSSSATVIPWSSMNVRRSRSLQPEARAVRYSS